MSFFRRRRAILDSILRNVINIGLGAAGLPGILCIATISERSIFISSVSFNWSTDAMGQGNWNEQYSRKKNVKIYNMPENRGEKLPVSTCYNVDIYLIFSLILS
jgi:hypothetical protein